jgi:hypothetical protein
VGVRHGESSRTDSGRGDDIGNGRPPQCGALVGRRAFNASQRGNFQSAVEWQRDQQLAARICVALGKSELQELAADTSVPDADTAIREALAILVGVPDSSTGAPGAQPHGVPAEAVTHQIQGIAT